MTPALGARGNCRSLDATLGGGADFCGGGVFDWTALGGGVPARMTPEPDALEVEALGAFAAGLSYTRAWVSLLMIFTMSSGGMQSGVSTAFEWLK